MAKYHLYNIINIIHIHTNKPKLQLLFDILKGRLTYKSSNQDYLELHMYELNSKQKNTLITKKINNKLIATNNKKSSLAIFKNRAQVLKKYHTFYSYDYLELSGQNISNFYDFAINSPTIHAYTNDYNNKNYDIVNIDPKNYTSTYNDLVISKKNIVTSIPLESSETKKINPNDYNYIRLIVYQNNIILALLITSNKEEKMYATINLDTGIIDYPAVNLKNSYDRHPLTNEAILWYQIPHWPRLKRFALKVSAKDSNLNYLELDILLTNTGPKLLNINPYPDYITYQIPNLVYNQEGLKNKFIKEMEK